MDPKINCLKCGSYIHDADHCWNWREGRWCSTDRKWKESCDCDQCKTREICQYCNYWSRYCNCVSERCPVCNEHLKNYGHYEIKCRWDHIKPPCKFCKLPVEKYNCCPNSHYEYHVLCGKLHLPQTYHEHHKHDGSLCKKCGTLLNYGKCIYQCVNGGNRCIRCHCESVVNSECLQCYKDQSGQLTKAAIK